MANPQGTSFIPQRPTRGTTTKRRVRKIYVLAYISYVLFFGSMLSAAGVFFFNFSLEVQLNNQRKALEAEGQQFSEADIESVRDLERRINIAEGRLDSHVSVLAIFEALEQGAVQSLDFVSFTYQRLNDGFPLVTFSGVSNKFSNILFQREALAMYPILAGSSFKEVAVNTVVDESNPEGQREVVSFTLEKEIDTSLIGYTPRATTQDQSQESSEQTQETILSDEETAAADSNFDEQ